MSMEVDDLDAAFAMIGGSEEPYDVWFREHVRNVPDIAPEESFPPPELILDYRADSVDL